jgi:hypothetical protein
MRTPQKTARTSVASLDRKRAQRAETLRRKHVRAMKTQAA